MTISQQSAVDALRSSSNQIAARLSRWPRRRCSFATLVREYSTVRRAERVLGCNGIEGKSELNPASRHDFSFVRSWQSVSAYPVLIDAGARKVVFRQRGQTRRRTMEAEK